MLKIHNERDRILYFIQIDILQAHEGNRTEQSRLANRYLKRVYQESGEHQALVEVASTVTTSAPAAKAGAPTCASWRWRHR